MKGVAGRDTKSKQSYECNRIVDKLCCSSSATYPLDWSRVHDVTYNAKRFSIAVINAQTLTALRPC